MTLSKIRLELDRTLSAPSGRTGYGMNLMAPLTQNEKLSSKDWNLHKKDCPVTHFNGKAVLLQGQLYYDPDTQGSAKPKWVSSDGATESSGYPFKNKTFRAWRISLTHHARQTDSTVSRGLDRSI